MSREYDGFTVFRNAEDIDARCAVKYEGTKEAFSEFVLVGIHRDEEDDIKKELCVTAVGVFDLYRIIILLQKVFRRALKNLPKDIQAKCESALLMDITQNPISFIDEEEKDELDDLL